MVRIDRSDHLVIFTNAGARHGNIRFEFKTPVGMLLFQIEEDLLNVAARFVIGMVGGTRTSRNRSVFSGVRLARQACPPRIPPRFTIAFLPPYDAFFSQSVDPFMIGAISSYILRMEFISSRAFAESRVNINAGAGDADPERPEMFKHNMCVGGLTENAHIRQDAVIH